MRTSRDPYGRPPLDAHVAGKLTAALLSAMTACFAGCAVGPDFVRPAPPAVDHYGNAADPVRTAAVDGSAQHFTPGGAVQAQWWSMFGSPQLSALMAQVIADNPGLEAARDSVRQSQYTLRSGYGVFFPQRNSMRPRLASGSVR